MNLRFGLHGAGNVNVDLSKMNKYAGRFGAGMVPVMGFGAVVFAALFDIVFAKVLPHLPFYHPMLGRIWYLTTAIAFAAAGYGAALMTKAGKGFVFTTAVVVAILYGALDIVIVKVIEGGDMHDALFLAIQGVAIGCVCGLGMAFKGFANRPA